MMEFLALSWGTMFVLGLKVVTALGLAYLCFAIPCAVVARLIGVLTDD